MIAVFVGIVLSVLIIIMVMSWYITRRDSSPKRISQEMRDEIEQNESWWLRSYHEILMKSGATVVAKINGTEWSERQYAGKGHRQNSRVIFHCTPDRVSLEGCICPECAEVLLIAEKNKKEQAELELRAAKAHAKEARERRVTIELQMNLGVPADGIIGPITLRAINMGYGNPSTLSVEAYELLHKIRHFRPSLPANHTQLGCSFEWQSSGTRRYCRNPQQGHGGRHQDGSAWVAVGAEISIYPPPPTTDPKAFMMVPW